MGGCQVSWSSTKSRTIKSRQGFQLLISHADERIKTTKGWLIDSREEGIDQTISNVLNILNASTVGDSCEDKITKKNVTDYIRTIRKSNIINESFSIICHFQNRRSDLDFYFFVEVDRFDII